MPVGLFTQDDLLHAFIVSSQSILGLPPMPAIRRRARSCQSGRVQNVFRSFWMAKKYIKWIKFREISQRIWSQGFLNKAVVEVHTKRRFGRIFPITSETLVSRKAHTSDGDKQSERAKFTTAWAISTGSRSKTGISSSGNTVSKWNYRRTTSIAVGYLKREPFT